MMTSASPTTTPYPRRSLATTLCIAALVVVGALATVGSFGQGFAIMTDCTDWYSCTTSSCGPCSEANTWLNGGWIAQGVLLLLAIVLLVLVRRVRRPGIVAVAAVVTLALSVSTFVVSGRAASHSYCQPGQVPTDMKGATANSC